MVLALTIAAMVNVKLKIVRVILQPPVRAPWSGKTVVVKTANNAVLIIVRQEVNLTQVPMLLLQNAEIVATIATQAVPRVERPIRVQFPLITNAEQRAEIALIVVLQDTVLQIPAAAMILQALNVAILAIVQKLVAPTAVHLEANLTPDLMLLPLNAGIAVITAQAVALQVVVLLIPVQLVLIMNVDQLADVVQLLVLPATQHLIPEDVMIHPVMNAEVLVTDRKLVALKHAQESHHVVLTK